MARYLFLVYLGLSFYFLLIVELTTVSFQTGIFSILALWLSYLAMLMGWLSIKTRFSTNNGGRSVLAHRLVKTRTSVLFYGSLSIFLSIVTMKFYTGMMPAQILGHWLELTSSYMAYQEHYNDIVAGTSIFARLPYILSQALIFMLFLTAVFVYINDKKIHNSAKLVFLVMCVIGYLYFGIARGTNFEMFVIANIIGFCLFSFRSRLMLKLLLFSTVIFLAYFIYTLSLGVRGFSFTYYITSDVFVNPSSYMYRHFPSISMDLISLYGYFGHGINFIGSFFSNVMFDNFSSIIAWLLPQGELFVGKSSIDSTAEFTSLGIRWIPSMMVMIDLFGLIGFIFVCFCCGIIGRTANNVGGCSGFILQFLMVLMMFSIPIGSFYGISYIVLSALVTSLYIGSKIFRFRRLV